MIKKLTSKAVNQSFFSIKNNKSNIFSSQRLYHFSNELKSSGFSSQMGLQKQMQKTVKSEKKEQNRIANGYSLAIGFICIAFGAYFFTKLVYKQDFQLLKIQKKRIEANFCFSQQSKKSVIQQAQKQCAKYYQNYFSARKNNIKFIEELIKLTENQVKLPLIYKFLSQITNSLIAGQKQTMQLFQIIIDQHLNLQKQQYKLNSIALCLLQKGAFNQQYLAFKYLSMKEPQALIFQTQERKKIKQKLQKNQQQMKQKYHKLTQALLSSKQLAYEKKMNQKKIDFLILFTS